MFELTRRPNRRSIFDFEDFDKNFETFFGPLSRESSFKPASEIVEKENEFLLSVDLPGVKKEDVTIDLHDNILKLSAQRKEEHNSEENGYLHSERFYGTYERSFRVPKNVSETDVQANLEDGILNIRLPKVESQEKRRIEIK